MGTLRIILALSVICAHAGGFLGYDMATGRGAVEAFFMLSGFLMQLVLAERYDPHKDLFLFYSNRALRIYPTYFLAVCFAFALYAAVYNRSAGFIYDLNAATPDIGPAVWAAMVPANLLIFGLDSFVFMQNDPAGARFIAGGVGNGSELFLVLPPAWSISLELTFYLLAPFLARLSWRWLAAVMAVSFALRLTAYAAGLDYDPWTHRFFPFEALLFVAGMLSYRSGKRILEALGVRAFPLAGPTVLLATLSVHPALLLAGRLHVPGDVVYFGYYAFMFLALPPLLQASRRSALDHRLGSLSFPVYLIHWPVIVAYNAYFGVQEDIYRGTLRTAACALATIAVAAGVVALVENPLEVLRRRRVRAERPQGDAGFALPAPAVAPAVSRG